MSWYVNPATSSANPGGTTTGMFGNVEVLSGYDANARIQDIQDYNAATFGDPSSAASLDSASSGTPWDPNVVAQALRDPDKAYAAFEAAQGRAHSTSEREAAQAFSALEAQRAFDRELQADSTAYQRRMRDLLAAGVNPLFAFGTGSASAGHVASTAATSSASSSGGSGARAGTSSAQVLTSIISTLGRIAMAFA